MTHEEQFKRMLDESGFSYARSETGASEGGTRAFYVVRSSMGGESNYVTFGFSGDTRSLRSIVHVVEPFPKEGGGDGVVRG